MTLSGKSSGVHDSLAPNLKLLPHVHGNNTERLLRILEALFPRFERSTTSIDPGDDPVVLEEGEVVPICFAIFPSSYSEPDPMVFFPPLVTDVHLLGGSGKKIRKCPDLETGSIMLSTTEEEAVQINLFPRKDQHKNLVQFKQPLDELMPESSLWKEWTSSSVQTSGYLWTSGAFLNHDPRQKYQVALFTSGMYSVQVNLVAEKSACALDTKGFLEVGGENIGSLFEIAGTLFASVRVTIPYNLHSIQGHGFRQSGVYRVQMQCPTTQWNCSCTARGDLVDVFMLEDECLSQCAAFLPQQVHLPRVNLDSSQAYHCEESKHRKPGWSRSLDKTVFRDCLLKNSANRRFVPVLSDMIRCSTSCRQTHQVYQGGAFTIFQRLYASFAYMYKKNGVYLCHGNIENLRIRCFHEPMYYAKSKPMHPLPSNIVLTKTSIIAASSCSHEVVCCTLATYVWGRDKFCSLASLRNASQITTLPLLMKAPCIHILYRLAASDSTCALSAIRVERGEGGIWQRLPATFHIERQTADEMLCRLVAHARLQGHRLRIWFSKEAIVGIRAATCAR